MLIKTHTAFCLDESGSVFGIIKPLVNAYNKNIESIQASILKQKQEATVSLFAFGDRRLFHRTLYVGQDIRNVKPLAHGSLIPSGNTPLFDSVARAIMELERLDDGDPNTCFIVTAVTDGQENSSSRPGVHGTIKMMQDRISTDRWTFTFLVPQSELQIFARNYYQIPAGNIQGWDEKTEAGTHAAFVTNAAAYDNYFGLRSSGLRSSSTFYADLNGVSAKKAGRKLAEITSDVKFFGTDKTIQISELAQMKTKLPYVKGTAFYQLTKPEKEVQAYKLIAIRNKTSKKVYAGSEAREMIGLDVSHTVRLAPGDHGNWDIFIQSTSSNRKIMPGTEIMVWKEAINYTN